MLGSWWQSWSCPSYDSNIWIMLLSHNIGQVIGKNATVNVSMTTMSQNQLIIDNISSNNFVNLIKAELCSNYFHQESGAIFRKVFPNHYRYHFVMIIIVDIIIMIAWMKGAFISFSKSRQIDPNLGDIEQHSLMLTTSKLFILLIMLILILNPRKYGSVLRNFTLNGPSDKNWFC